MEKNVGQLDKTARIILGITLIVVGIVTKSWWGAIGIVPLITASLGNCPLYSVLGVSTCSKKEQK
ncbi:YgaP family membrane protein [Halanaerobacter jeridensis]|uniref:Inner membrane protein YgaP-like transmembrane domain-containing protein n=1 Tax=Halanaerobacter jeridensis TaxID=706427 RepID=A0A939BMV5_9FIRM|nr:DUF2892 domain-containing protein [Halanaerobacter jeridensis]MBM7557585.1 hypothetical protein [Halanaerobacter jeridensis]